LQVLEKEIQRGLHPDLTLLLDAPLEVGERRIAARTLDHFEREQRPFFERVRAGYLALAREHPSRITVVDAARSLDEVQGAIDQHVHTLIERFVS